MKSIASYLVLAVLALLPGSAFSQEHWPSHRITIVVPYAAGGVTDFIARSLAPRLADALHQPVIVENKPGGHGLLGTDYVARARPDGYTLTMMIDTNTIAPSLYAKLKHDPLKDFAPITLLAEAPMVIVANPSFGPSSLRELITMARHASEPIFYGNSGTGTALQLAMEQLKLKTGMNLTSVPYKGGGQQIIALLGGQVKLGIIGVAPALPHINAGKLKALAVTSTKRLSVLADVPTVEEQGVPGFESLDWFGLLAPAGTPKEIVDRLHDEAVKAMKDPALEAPFSKFAVSVHTSATPADFASFMKKDIAKWAEIIKAAHIKKL